MSNCSLRLIIKNQFTDASVAVSPSPRAGFPANNMLMTWRSRVMRTSGVTAQKIEFTLPVADIANAFYCPVNGEVQLRLELFADNTLTNRVYDSGITLFGVKAQQVLPLGRWAYGVNAIGEEEDIRVGAARVLYFDDTRYTSGRITLDWSASPTGWIEVPYLVIGKAFAPMYGASYGLSLGGRMSRKRQRTRGGSLHGGGNGTVWREMSLDLGTLSEEERVLLEAELWETSGDTVLVDAYPENTGVLHDHHLFLAAADLPDIEHKSYGAHAAKLRFEEI